MAKKTTKKKSESSETNKYKEFSPEIKEKIKLISSMYKELRDIVLSHADIFYPEKPFNLVEISFIEKYYKTYTGDDKVPQNLSKELSHTQNCRIDSRLKHMKSIIASFEASYMDEEAALYLISSHLVVMLTELRFK